MPGKTEARIYPAHQRACTQSEVFRSYYITEPLSTFSQGRPAFGNLLEVCDDTLTGHYRLKVPLNAGVTVILIPVVGSVRYSTPFASGVVEAGECRVIPIISTTVMELYNPFEKELINLLRFHITGLPGEARPIAIPLDLDHFGRPVRLSGPGSDAFPRGFVVKIRGREDNIHHLHQGIGAFAFVVEGTVEVEGRLLDARDGLALWGTDHLEFEALTAEAIIILLEISCAISD